MSAFYGDIKNSNRISLIFDKIYRSRAEMDDSCMGDGIFNGRFVLIDYGQAKAFPFTRVFPTEEEYKAGVKVGKYYQLEVASPEHTDYGDLGFNPNSVKQYSSSHPYKPTEDIYFIKRDSLLDMKTLTAAPQVAGGHSESWPEISEYVVNKEKDLGRYSSEYQHTVWQKIWVQTGSPNTVEEKYICVAHLDAAAPIINLIVDAPTDNDTPGYFYTPTTKNKDGYLTKVKFNSLISNANTWVYIKEKDSEGQDVYKPAPADKYDSNQIYYIFESTEYHGQEEVYEKQYNADGSVKQCQIYVFPTVYKCEEILAADALKQPEGTKFYLSFTDENGEQYFSEAPNLTGNDKYYIFTETNYATDVLLYYKPNEGLIFKKFIPTEFYTVKEVPDDEVDLAPSGFDFLDGYITKEDYDSFKYELFYYNEDKTPISVYQKIATPEDGASCEGIYYKGSDNNYLIKTTTNYPEDYEYFKKDPYDSDKRYLEFTFGGSGPHFDPLRSTDLEYQLHVPRQWKFAREVDFDYRLEGFSPYVRPTTQLGANSITLETQTDEEKFTTRYPEHISDLPEAALYTQKAQTINGEPVDGPDWSGTAYEANLVMKKQADTKQFNIKLPEIGQAIADMWDTIYPRGNMNPIETDSVPDTEFNVDFTKNILLTDEGYAKYYYLAPHLNGYLTVSRFNELKKEGNLFELLNGQYFSAQRYGYNEQYYEKTDSGYQLVPTDVKIYRPIYNLDEIKQAKEQNEQFYTFEKHPDGDIRIMFMGNDRTPEIFYGEPQTMAETIRHAYLLLGLKTDDDTLENPPRGTIYGLLNGAKTIYGDPKDTISGHYEKINDNGKFTDEQKEEWFQEGVYVGPRQLWTWDTQNMAWVLVEEPSEDGEDYYYISEPAYQLIPNPIGEDGRITKDLYDTLKALGKGPIYIQQPDGTFIESKEYVEGKLYYSNLTTLWGYLNDMKSKFPLYQANWANNSSNSIGYIHNRPKMVIKKGEYEITEENNNFILIEDMWNKYNAVDS